MKVEWTLGIIMAIAGSLLKVTNCVTEPWWVIVVFSLVFPFIGYMNWGLDKLNGRN